MLCFAHVAMLTATKVNKWHHCHYVHIMTVDVSTTYFTIYVMMSVQTEI